MKARVLSGIQPTGSPHIGNYLGALKNWAKIQYDYDSIMHYSRNTFSKVNK